MRTRPCGLLVLGFLASCADGGEESTPDSEVLVSSSFNYFSFRALPGFGSFPISPSVVYPDSLEINFRDDGTYTFETSSGEGSPQTYLLYEDGRLRIVYPGGGGAPAVYWDGAYELTRTENADHFVTDRSSLSNSQALGMLYGTQIDTTVANADITGPWHLFSSHVVFAGTGAVSSPNNVGLNLHGAVSVVEPNGSNDNVSGTGSESSGRTVTLGGTLGLLTNGKANLTLRYTDSWSSQGTESRVFQAAVGKDIVMAVDRDETDGEAGMLMMMRKFDVPTTVATLNDVAGDYYVGAYTTFVNPSNPGADGAVGTLELSNTGNFAFTMVGSRGIEFQYTGTFVVAEDGLLTFTVSGTSETWRGAVNRDYKTLVVMDDVVENRTNTELNFFFAVREKPPDPPAVR
ncbi:MAG: hypothetical protein RL148_340 [Planctomycetota bacterium]|jgi:hypothetical protein